MLGLAWLGRDSSQHAGAGCPDPAPEVSTGPQGPWISYQALAGPGAPLRGPGRLLRASTRFGVSGGVWRLCAGPGRPLRASRLDSGCLEVCGGPGRPLRASRGLQTPPDGPLRSGLAATNSRRFR